MNSPQQIDKADTPDTPPEVLAAQARSRPLNRTTAELIEAKEYVDESGHLQPLAFVPSRGDAAAKEARQRAEAFMGGEPLRGIPVETIAAVRANAWPDAPAMDPEIGQRTPAFVNWLWANHPKDAKIVYAYKDIWPTVLPAVWPPAAAGAGRQQPAQPKPKAKWKPKPKMPAPATPTITTP